MFSMHLIHHLIRIEIEKWGQMCLTCALCCRLQCGAHRPLKVFIIELALNWINHKHKTQACDACVVIMHVTGYTGCGHFAVP